MNEAAAFADGVARVACSALSEADIQTESFSIGDLSFQLTGRTQAVEDWLGRAFLPSQTSSARSVGQHRLVVWDGIDREVLPPRAPWAAHAPEPLGLVCSHSDDIIRCAIDIHTNSLLVCNFARNSSHTWYPNIAVLPAWAKASPFRIILSWLCNHFRMQIVHGSAVAINGRGVLLAGAGGAGKSTTALACMLAGLDYLADDYCAVDPAAGKVHMVYRTAKLFKSSLDLMPALTGLICNLDRIAEEKGVIFLEPDDVNLVPTAQLTAILLPRISSGSMTTLQPATRQDAVNAILPSTIGGLMGGTSVTPRLILELVRSVPAFHLSLGSDLNRVTDTIASKLMVV